MNLRTKTFAIISLTIIGLLVALYLAATSVLLSGFARVEEQDTRQNVRRVLDAYAADLEQLNITAGDWATWDDTYAFIADRNQAYIDSNLTDDAFARLKLNLMVFADPSGHMVFGAGFDLQAQQRMPVPASFQTHLVPDDLLLQHPDLDTGRMGIVLLPEGPLVVVSRPILMSDGSGPSRGSLIMGRYLDATGLAQLAERTHVTLTVQRSDAPQLAPDFQAAQAVLLGGAPSVVQAVSEDTVAGYTLLRDLYAQPALVGRVAVPRAIYQQGQFSMHYLIVALVLVGLAFGVMTLLLVERLILARLAQLNLSVKRIGARSDLAARVALRGQDELAQLAQAINGMLDALAQAIAERARTEAEAAAEREQLQEQRIGMQAAELQLQAMMLAELSTPLIPISAQTVVMPLIGTLDAPRAQQVVATLLTGITERRAQVAILDITGVCVVDTLVANALIQAAQAVQLLGAQLVLTGIRPEVAQTLVGLGVELGSISTYSTLQTAIATVMRRHEGAAAH
ncbi:MAG TPA: CHASE4 domain-containing protein [Roseiflexaceae bacterium]|nr:CHASE4 domain-containing protein [Roseiflexaceae bacterium]